MNGGLRAAGRAGRVLAQLYTKPANGNDGEHEFTLRVNVAAPWHIYAPGASSGLPVEISAEPPMRVSRIEFPVDSREHLRGTFVITGALAGAYAGSMVMLRTQACDGPRCEPPAFARLTLVAQVSDDLPCAPVQATWRDAFRGA